MSQMTTSEAGWLGSYNIAGSGDKTIKFSTENKFVDKDINFTVHTEAAASLTLAISDQSVPLTVSGSPGDLVYTASIPSGQNVSASLTAGTPGWLTAGPHTLTDSSGIVVGTLAGSTMTLGSSSFANDGTITPSDSSQTLTIGAGYYNAPRTVNIGAADSSAAGAITSGSATISSVSYSYDSTNDYFTVSGSADVSAPTVNTPGYISTTKGTKSANTNGATVSTTVDKIILKSTLTGVTSAQKPTIAKQTISITGVTDAASGNAQTTAPTSGVYVAVKSAANTGVITSNPQVKTAGYGTTGYYGTDTATTATVGAAASDMTYVPITTTTATKSGRTVSYGSGWISSGSTSIDVGTITSGAGTAIISDPTWDSTESKFTQTASGSIAAPSVNTDGYVSASEGTKNGNNISGSKDLDTITINAYVFSGTSKVTPVIARTARPSGDTWVDAASGSATTTKPTSGAYVRADVAAKSSTIIIKGTVESAGYGTTSHFNSGDAVGESVGCNASASTYIPITAGTVTSGSGTVSSISVAYNSTNSNFNVTGSADVSAPTYTEGYISSSVGTKNSNTGGATVAATLAKIGITATISGTGTKQPSITKNSATNIPEAGSATTTQPSSGYYVAVKSDANTGTVTATPSVSSAGYGTTTSGQYTATNSDSFTVGASASSVTYIPISAASFANTASNGVTYTDISSTAPALISGDYLYINAGYATNQKISLAKLVPDAIGANATASYILNGYTAYNNDGALITGNIATYDGSYTIT